MNQNWSFLVLSAFSLFYCVIKSKQHLNFVKFWNCIRMMYK